MNNKICLLTLFLALVFAQDETRNIDGFVDKTTDHPFFSNGQRKGFTIGGVQSPDIEITEGALLTLSSDVTCAEGGKVYISTDAAGGPGAAGISFVQGVGCDTAADTCACEGNALTFTPNANHVGTLYYASTTQSFAGGRIIVKPSVPPTPIKIFVSPILRTAAHPNQAGTGGTDCIEGAHPVAYAICDDLDETNCVEGKELNLLVGQPYEFHNTKCSHPFYLSNDVRGKGGDKQQFNDRITDGVTISKPGVSVCEGESNFLTFTPTIDDMGKPFFYQCEIHCRMGWKINIVQQSICGKYSNALGITNQELLQTVVDGTVTGITTGSNDPLVKKYFDGTVQTYSGAPITDFVGDATELDALKAKLVSFFGQEGVLSCRDGSIPASTVTVGDLGPIHDDMPINTKEFNAFNKALLDVLVGAGVESEDVTTVGQILESTKPLICNDPDCSPNFVPTICQKYSAALGVTNIELMLDLVVAIFGNLTATSSVVSDFFDGTYNCVGTTDKEACGFNAEKNRECSDGTNTLSEDLKNGAKVSCLPDYTRAYDGTVDSDDPNSAFNDDLYFLAINLIAFFGGALGCTDAQFPQYTGPSMAQVHQYLPIGPTEFNGFNDIFLSTLKAKGVEQVDLDPIEVLLNAFKFDVCTTDECRSTICETYAGALTSGDQTALMTTIIDAIVAAVVADPLTGPYFDGTKPAGAPDFTAEPAVTNLKESLVAFFGAVFGCNDGTFPVFTEKASLSEIHEPMGINTAEFDKFNDLAIQELQKLGVSDADLINIRRILDNTKAVICFDDDCNENNQGETGNPPIILDFSVQTKTKAHPWFGMGFGSGYAVSVDGGDFVEGGTIFLDSSKDYNFVFKGTCFHPLYLTADATGGDGGSSVLSAVGLSGTNADNDYSCGGDIIEWLKPSGGDGFYQCVNHGKMGGPFRIDAPPAEEVPESFCDLYTRILVDAVVDNNGLITTVVTDTVALALADVDLVKFFNGGKPSGAVDFTSDTAAYDALAGKLVSYFATVLGCTDGSTTDFGDLDLTASHAPLPIFEDEFIKFNGALVSVLAKYGVSKPDQDFVAGFLESTKSQVCTCCDNSKAAVCATVTDRTFPATSEATTETTAKPTGTKQTSKPGTTDTSETKPGQTSETKPGTTKPNETGNTTEKPTKKTENAADTTSSAATLIVSFVAVVFVCALF